MHTLDIEGIPVEFPYKPYDIQIAYMTKVITALKAKSNALLESPTGTGKTLCLLCASLAWLEYEKARQQLARLTAPPDYPVGQDVPASWAAQKTAAEAGKLPNEIKIIYASRTHSQLAQVMQELKKTPYRSVRVATLGSRDQLCINSQVISLPNIAAKNKVCRDKVKAHSCKFYAQLEQQTKDGTLGVQDVPDIEDLVSFGKKNRVCPYYLAKSFEKSAEVLFMPYNYIFDPTVKRSIKLDLANAVVILDEGHNVGKVCEDSYSFELSSVDLATSIKETHRILLHLVKSSEVESVTAGSTIRLGATKELIDDSRTSRTNSVASLKRLLLDFESELEKIPLSDDTNAGLVKPVSFLRDLFAASGIHEIQYSEISTFVNELVSESEQKDQFSSIASHNVGSLQKFVDLMEVVFSKDYLKHHTYFRVYLRKEDVRKKLREGWSGEGLTTKQSRIVSVWCLSPSCTLQTIVAEDVHSLLITSGTLTPAAPLLKEFKVPFPVQIFNPHIVKSSQVWVGVVSKGPDGIEWTSQFKNRDSMDYRRSLGRGILNFLEVIPDGVLIFFPSYRVMQDCIDSWKALNLWDTIIQRKTAFVEPTNRNEFTTMLVDYFKAARSGNGAAFFGVCRGKISEGVDFPDVCARGVILTGLPYPNKFEPRIRVKMEYLQQTFDKPDTRTLSPNEWYNREAWSTVNQALGRVIRHASDFGACLLCDCRFGYEGNKKELSGWVKNSLRSYTFPVAKRWLADFFREHASESKPANFNISIREIEEAFGEENREEVEIDQTPVVPLPSDAEIRNMYVKQKAPAKAKRSASVFEAMDVREANAEMVHPVEACDADVPSTFASLPSSQASSSQRRKIIVNTRPSATVKVETAVRFTSESPERDVSQKRLSENILGASQKILSEKIASVPGTKLPEKVLLTKKGSASQIASTISVLKAELDGADFVAVSRALSTLRQPNETSCSGLVSALIAVKKPERVQKISLALSRFIPSRFRAEYETFLTEMGYLVSL